MMYMLTVQPGGRKWESKCGLICDKRKYSVSQTLQSLAFLFVLLFLARFFFLPVCVELGWSSASTFLESAVLCILIYTALPASI